MFQSVLGKHYLELNIFVDRKNLLMVGNSGSIFGKMCCIEQLIMNCLNITQLDEPAKWKLTCWSVYTLGYAISKSLLGKWPSSDKKQLLSSLWNLFIF